METVILGIAWYIVFLLSSTVHEAAHALAALKLGDRTAYHGGQVSIDPRPHIRQEPFGMIVVPILTYFLSGWMMGWASVPYDPHWAQRYPKRSAVMSLAGPTANLSLALIAGLLIRVGILLGWFYAPDSIDFTHVTAVMPDMPSFFNGLATMLSILFTLNMVLFAFNLIPLPPLDGSGILPLILTADMNRQYQQFLSQPAISIFGLLIAWRLFDFVFDPIFTLSLNLLYPGAHYG